MTDASTPMIRLVADDARRRRYPERTWLGEDLVEVSATSTEGNVVGAVVDLEARPAEMPDDVALLVSLDVLAELLRSDEFPPATWTPLLPVDFSADVQTARTHVTTGKLGAPQVIDITVPAGLPLSAEWDMDTCCALSRLEALVFGLRVSELVGDAPVAASTWLVRELPVQTIVHELENGIQVVHHIVPSATSAIAGYEGIVLAEAGRIALRQQFAPGAMGIWRSEHSGYTFPSIPVDKHDVQAPDSATGGWEMTSLLRQLVQPSAQNEQLRAAAIRLVRHAQDLMTGGST